MHDDVPKHTKNYNTIMSNYDDSYGLEKTQYFAFILFAGMLKQTLLLDQEEKKIVSDFLANCTNNPSFNSIFNAAIQKMGLQEYQLSADKIRELSHRTRRLGEFNEALDKLNVEKIRQGLELHPDEKLTLRNYAIMRDLAALTPLFNEFKKLTVVTQNKQLSDLDEKIKKARSIENAMELRIRIDTHFSQGLFISSSKKKAFLNKNLFNFFAYLKRNFITVSNIKPEPSSPSKKP